ncbi:RICIN domain-containing protein [Streptomyces sp. NBC_01384]
MNDTSSDFRDIRSITASIISTLARGRHNFTHLHHPGGSPTHPPSRRATPIGYSGQYWRWTGTTNTSSTLQNYTWGHCLDSNSAGDVYANGCNGGNNQLWQVVQPAAGSAVLLRNTATRLCLYQAAGGLYRTTTCDRNARTQRWTIG